MYKNQQNDQNKGVTGSSSASGVEQVENDTSGQNNVKGDIPSKPVNKPSNTVEITSISENSNSKEVVVQTKLRGVGLKECTIIFTKGNSTFSEKAEVIYQSEFSTCAGFSIDTSRFSSSGEWTATLKVSKNDGSSINSQSKTVNISKS